jgi:hypothetical protein
VPGSTNQRRGDERGQQGGDTVVLDGYGDGQNNWRQLWRRKGFERNTSEEREGKWDLFFFFEIGSGSC